ncbi:MAG: arabinose isomerase [Propioniciclava sp.]
MSTTWTDPVQAPGSLERRSYRRPKLALAAGGLGVYWGQFDGLLDTLKRSAAQITTRLTDLGANVEHFGFISDPAEGQAVADKVRASDPDLVVLFVSTYMTSAQVLPLFKYGGAPVLLLCLQPTSSMDHENFGTGDWLAYAGSAGLPEMCVALERLNLPARSVSGHLDDPRAWAKIARWVRAATVVANLRRGRFGLLGHLYPGMFDIATNITSSYATFGGHVEILELDDLRRLYDQVTDTETEARFNLVGQVFNITAGTDLDNVRFQSRVSVALDHLMDEYALDTLSYFHMGNSDDIYSRLATGFPIGATLLSTRGYPTVTEFELRAGIAMQITGMLGGGGTFTEGQALDFDRGQVELGHNDAADAAITSDRPVLRSLKVFHGKAGGGASVEATVRPGPVTQFSIGELHDGRLRLIASEGEAVPGPGIKIGNTTTRIDFGCDPGDWTDAWATSGSTHHWSMAVGHLADDIQAVASLLDAAYVRIQP